jgi:CheY-like chemotaxis protein
MTVLLVDDDQDDVDLFFEALKEIDKSIIPLAAYNGVEALNILDGDLIEVPDYIFLDINMPVMTGLEVLQNIRGKEKFQNTPVTMYTTSSNPKDMLRCKELGAEYLIKPATYSTLISTLQQRLNA